LKHNKIGGRLVARLKEKKKRKEKKRMKNWGGFGFTFHDDDGDILYIHLAGGLRRAISKKEYMCKCGHDKVFLPKNNGVLVEECLTCTFNYDRVVYYRDGVIPSLRIFVNEVTYTRAYIYWCLKPQLSRDISKKIALLYVPKKYDGWTIDDYKQWLILTGPAKPKLKPKPKRKRNTSRLYGGVMCIALWVFAGICYQLILKVRNILFY
jgi:hypothetical protein